MVFRKTDNLRKLFKFDVVLKVFLNENKDFLNVVFQTQSEVSSWFIGNKT